MIIEPANRIVKRIKSVYDRDKYGWRVLAGLDEEGRLDIYVIHRSGSLWKLKSKPVNPFSYISVGAKIRDVNREIFEKVLNESEPFSFQALFPQSSSQSIIMLGLGKYLPRRRTPVSESEKPLDQELAKKVEELFSRIYPERKTTYV